MNKARKFRGPIAEPKLLRLQLAAVEKRFKMFVLLGGLPSLTNYDDDSFYAEVQRASTSRDEFQKYATVIEPYNPEHFVANTGPAKIYFQWATHDMYISRHSAEEYYKAVGGPKEQHWYFTRHEFNDAQSACDRREWLAKELGLQHSHSARNQALGTWPVWR